jgi:hypothetical protein
MAKKQESYIEFVQVPPVAGEKRKTKIWQVRAKEDGAFLGEVRWFGRWRGYSYFPYNDTIYEHRCLRDIAEFVESKSKAHRKGWGKKKQQPPSAWERLSDEGREVLLGQQKAGDEGC